MFCHLAPVKHSFLGCLQPVAWRRYRRTVQGHLAKAMPDVQTLIALRQKLFAETPFSADAALLAQLQKSTLDVFALYVAHFLQTMMTESFDFTKLVPAPAVLVQSLLTYFFF